MTKLEALVQKLNTTYGGNLTVEGLQSNVVKMSPMELNEFIEGLFNKVFKSYIFERVIFSHPILKTFVQEGTSFEAHREYFDNQLIESSDYKLSEKMIKDVKTTKVLQTILSTQLKKVLPLTINLHQSRAAFASEQAFSQWVESQFRVITESMNIELYNVISNKIFEGVKNTLDLSTINKFDDLLEAVNTLSDNMAFPSKAYNLGYQSQGTGINVTLDPQYDDVTRTNSTSRSDMILFVSPTIKNRIDSRVGSIKFHNQYFDISKYNVITLDKSKLTDSSNDEYIMLVDKNAFKGYFRINEMVTQFWGANLTTDYIQHYWLVFGEIPWANGVKIKLNKDLLK